MNDHCMKYIDEYRDRGLIMKLVNRIRSSAKREYTFMEVCGGHTNAIHRFGIPSLLPDNIRLVSGPGCPVCVTGRDFIDQAIAYSKKEDFIIATFGDLIRVPGSSSDLEKEKAHGADIRIVFSGLDALEIAKMNSDKKVVFLGIGFETTAPGTAVTLKEAMKCGAQNFFVLSAHKIMPPAMEAIIKDGTKINGYICPGHVSAISGSAVYDFIPERYGIGCVVTGFEPVDILQSIYMLIDQVETNSPAVEIQYSRAVTREGNILAQGHMRDVFKSSDDWWRGFGIIADSGLRLSENFIQFDASQVFPERTETVTEDSACICGDILRGMKKPSDCNLFGTMCIPENPVGACMVSNEGACSIFYKYKRNG
jgi:hydrogenase expression/formation protein HypD